MTGTLTLAALAGGPVLMDAPFWPGSAAWAAPAAGGDAAAQVGEFDTPPIAPLDDAARAALRGAVAAAGPEVRAAADAEVARGRSVMHDPARPIAAIHYEGLVHTDPRRIETVAHLDQMRDAAWLLRAWQLTEDPALADTLRAWITAWAGTYRVTGNEVNEAKLLPLLIAYEALRAGFPEPERAAVDGWVRRLGEHHVRRVRDSTYYTNRFTKHLAIAAHAARVLDEPGWHADTVAGARRMVDHALFADGTSRDLRERDTLTYHASALRVLTELSLLLPEVEGEPLYRWVAPGGGSVERSVGYLLPYARGEKTREEWRNSRVELDRRRGEAGLEAYRPGRLYDPANAIELLELASFYDASLVPLTERLLGESGHAGPSWRLLLRLGAQASAD